ncbi:MAG: hypothetical protein ABIS92_08045, partial [Polyangia bacterium]
TRVVMLRTMADAEVAGVKPAAYWNALASNSGSKGSLKLSDGSTSTASATWNAQSSSTSPAIWWVGYPDAAGDVRMMNGYLDVVSSSPPGTVTVSNLPAALTSGGYDVYVYCTGGVFTGTRGYTYAIGGVSYTISQTGPPPTQFSGYVLAAPDVPGNYIVFRGVTGTSFTLTATPASGTTRRAPVNGLQIVWPPGM